MQKGHTFSAFAFVYNHRRTPGKRQQIFVVTHQMRFILRIFPQFACARSVLSFLHGFLLLSARIPFRTKIGTDSVKSTLHTRKFILVFVENKFEFGNIVFCHFKGRRGAAQREKRVFVRRKYHLPAFFVNHVVVHVIPVQLPHARIDAAVDYRTLTAHQHHKKKFDAE